MKLTNEQLRQLILEAMEEVAEADSPPYPPGIENRRDDEGTSKGDDLRNFLQNDPEGFEKHFGDIAAQSPGAPEPEPMRVVQDALHKMSNLVTQLNKAGQTGYAEKLYTLMNSMKADVGHGNLDGFQGMNSKINEFDDGTGEPAEGGGMSPGVSSHAMYGMTRELEEQIKRGLKSFNKKLC